MHCLHTHSFLSLIKLLIVVCILIVPVQADPSSATDGSTPLGLQQGAPAGSYPLSGFDNVNLFNGSLNFQLSLFGVVGRGGAGMPVLLPIEGKWRVTDIAIPQPGGSFNHSYLPLQEWWENNDRKYRPGSLVGRQGSFDVMTCPDSTAISVITLKRLTFTAPDGTEYELRDLATGGQPANNQGCNYLNPPSRGKVFVTADGSAATFVSESPIFDYVISPNPEAEFYPTGYLMLRDGTRFRINAGRVDWMRDRNGNKLTFGYDSNNRVTTITDSLNRVVSIARTSTPGNFDQITYKGFKGATRIVKVNYSSLASALRSDYASTLTYKSLFPELDGSSTSHHNPSVVSSITLPNNQEYFIRYNPYGEVARVVLPTGGAVEYDYAAGDGALASGSFAGGFEGSWVIYRRVVERRVYPDGGTGAAYASRMTYSRTEAECAGCVKVDQFNSAGTLLTRSKHYFHGNAGATFAIGPTDYSGWKQGREYQTEAYASDGTTVLSRVAHTWQQPTGGNNWPLAQAETSDTAKSNNPQITQTVTTLEPAQVNKVSKQTFTYDKYTNRTDVYDYDFGNGSAGSLVRRTRIDYLTSSYDTLSPDSINPDVSLTTHIRNLPVQVSVFDAAGVERARSTTEYDNYTLDGADCLHSFHCPPQARANISGLDAQFNSSYTKRGNATAVVRYLLAGGTGSISSYSQYDVAGNVVRVLDPRSTLSNNIATNIEYDDRFGIPDDNEARSDSVPSELTGFNAFAFPTKITNASGHISYTQFDYYLGLPVNAEDANGVIASGYFNDPLDRPKQIQRAVVTGVENQTTFAYDDAARVVTTSSDKDANGDNRLVSEIRYDQMGRTIEARQYEGGTNYIATQTQYDMLGRPFKTSNPFRPWQGETAVWSVQGFDALGRVTSITTPDRAVLATAYSGDRVLVTDQNGKQRISRTNALGQLKEVWEMTAPDDLTEAVFFPLHPEVTAAYRTSYDYDVLDNLTTVRQGSQTRTFVYDSLKRLKAATNPESGTVAYNYDKSGNLLVKTDARGVSSHFEYDVLNRLTRRWYNGSSLVSATTHNSPALPAGVGVTDEAKLYYDSQALPTGAPSYIRGAAIGRLVAQTYGSGSNGDYLAYDALGHATLKFQQTGTINYGMSASYNRSGAITTLNYPSNRSVNYTYDEAGRLLSFTGNLGDGALTPRTYATDIFYSPFGGPVKEKFGTTTPVYNKLYYNSRGQLAEIRVSTSCTGPTDTTWNRGAIINHYSEQCWGMCSGSSMTDNNGNLKKQEVYIPNDDQISGYSMRWQQYDYDSLNRLNWVREIKDGTEQWKQQFTYDRWGNRTLNTGVTYGVGINNKAFTVDTSNNRLGVPLGQSGVMTYDAAGNLTNDTYTGAGNRTYDAENKITSAWGGNNQAQLYSYDANGQRIKRTVDGVETWQVYGFAGELLAEYPANGAAASPQKEYGYRNGQLLVTISGSQRQWLIPDHLGTPRMVLDQTGSLANVKRHDYLPFGEELFASIAGRTVVQGYAAVDGVRQQFTTKERDIETSLDYFVARYYSPIQGRFTSTDPGSFVPADPQSWNRYSYTQNNPLKFTDPTGEDLYITGDYADQIVADLARFSGFKLHRDSQTGKVTIDPRERKSKGTSYALATALGRAIGNEKVSVSIETVSEFKNQVEMIGDKFTEKKLDIDDYNVVKRDAPEYAAAFLTHVVTEYYEAQLLPAELSLQAIFDQAHATALEAESDTIGDFNGWWQAPRTGGPAAGSLGFPPLIVRFIFSTVEYDMVFKAGVGGRATQVDQVIKIDRTPKPKRRR